MQQGFEVVVLGARFISDFYKYGPRTTCDAKSNRTEDHHILMTMIQTFVLTGDH